MKNFWSNNYIEYESNGDRNKTLSNEKHLNKIRPYLTDITTDFEKSDTWELILTIAINFISFNNYDKGRVMHSKVIK